MHIESDADFNFVCQTILATRGNRTAMEWLADERAPSSRAKAVIKAGVVGQSLTTSAALAPYAGLADGFFESMGPQSAFATIWAAGDFLRTPLRTQIAVMSTAPTASTVSELGAKPLSAGTFTSATLEANKVTSFIVVTNELARHGGEASQVRLGNELRRAAGIAADAKFLALMAATAGVTSAASTGITSAAILSDLTARVDAMTTLGSDSKLWWIVSPKVFKRVAMNQGTGGFLVIDDMIGPIRMVASDAATTVGTLIDAAQIAADLDSVTLDVAREATIQMDSAPSASAAASVSLFQDDLVGMRCEVYFGAVATRSTAVTLLTGYA